MTKQEKATLDTISKNLMTCTRVTWTQGDLAKWSKWAEAMRSEINSSVNLINALTDSSEESSKETQAGSPLTLD